MLLPVFRGHQLLMTSAFVGAIGIFLPTGEARAATAGATSAAADRTARDYRGASPYEQIKDEPPPRLIVDPPFEAALAQGVFQAQYRVENLRIENVFGSAAVGVSPRLGHLHVIVDDLPWWWADASDNNTVDVANLPPGPHKVTIQLVNPNHEVFPGQVVTLQFNVPPRAGASHGHQHR